jgi:hypothetical protein
MINKRLFNKIKKIKILRKMMKIKKLELQEIIRKEY